MPRASRHPPSELIAKWPPGPATAAPGSAGEAALQAAGALARNVEALRAEQRLSQAAVAKIAGLSERSVRKLERGEVWPDVETAGRLAYALGVTASELFAD